MSVVIRMSRGGRKKLPYYSIVVADKRAPRDGRFIEKVGSYNPMLAKDDANRVTLVEDRIKAWLAEGAQPSERVQSFLAKAGLMKTAKKKFDQTKQHLPKAKAQERTREKEQALKDKAEEEAQAKLDAEEAAKAASEAPAEETPAVEEAEATSDEVPAETSEAPAEESAEKKEEDAA